MSLLSNLQQLCIEKKVSIVVAESCTAGLIASKLTDLSGSSSYFKGGIVAYQNEIKTKILGVSQSIIDEKTEVSAEVVKQMAKSVLKKFDADLAIATSGYAGPTGGTNKNPIGTVFIAIASAEGVVTNRFIFSGNRQSVVNQASESSLDLLYAEVKKQQ
ncbi:MAG: CinA family protein [Flavobacteriales bacterium]|jgi:PncC family amidohydrolase|nr:CinA family protein [Flavobacteriales bacterium]MBT5090261.1 CinA family protein [Flavobacteriales bacterium]MBT5750068.1 CinA family protein [Flavobacteriales bacterium]